MRPAPRCREILVAALAAVSSVAAGATEQGTSAGIPLIYGLTGNPVAEQSLLAARWSTPSLSLRLDAAAGLGAHEVRILSLGSTPAVAPMLTGLGAIDARSDLGIEPVRATYRYTLLAEPSWAMKFGLSTNLREPAGSLRAGQLGIERSGFGSLPMVHLAGVGQWSPRWRLAFAVDGLATGKGRALDLDLQVDFLWTQSMSVFGGYQVSDAAGEAESYYGAGLSNRANIGVRYRF